MWQNTVLNEILTEVFKRHNLKKLSDIKAATGIDLRVVCADLRSADPVVYKPNGNDKDIVTALMDSAGIPIYFRTWRDGSYVDGGVVQNFPWEELIDTGGASKGPILGLSFASEARDIANTRLGYAGALLNTALDSATERARAHLGADRVLTLPNRFGTFDFKEAFSSASLKDHFDSAKWETGNWLDSRLRDSAVLVTDDPWRHQHLFDGEDR